MDWFELGNVPIEARGPGWQVGEHRGLGFGITGVEFAGEKLE
jgi:hypothetical protein